MKTAAELQQQNDELAKELGLAVNWMIGMLRREKAQSVRVGYSVRIGAAQAVLAKVAK